MKVNKRYILVASLLFLLLLTHLAVSPVSAVSWSLTIKAEKLFIDKEYDGALAGNGDFYLRTGCERGNGIWDYEKSSQSEHGGSYYKVTEGTFEHDTPDAQDDHLEDDIVVKYEDDECSAGSNHFRIWFREWDNGPYENVNGLTGIYWNIPEEGGTYTVTFGTFNDPDISGLKVTITLT